MKRTCSVICLTAILLSMRAGSQTIHLAPHAGFSRILDTLLSPAADQPLTLESYVDVRGENSLIPLDWARQRRLPLVVYHGTDPYFSDYQTWEVALERGKWRLSWASVNTDLYEGNPSGAQLYLDAQHNQIPTTGASHPLVTMNRTSYQRISVGYETPLSMRLGVARIGLAGNLLLFDRVQYGNISGDMVNGQFTGHLSLLTTRGLPNSQTYSPGASIDTWITVPLVKRWNLGIRIENLLGIVQIRKMQDIEADVATNTVIPDENGFLHGAPLINGKVTHRSVQANLSRRWWAGLTRPLGAYNILITAQNDRYWRGGTGISGIIKRSGRWWTLFQTDPFEWQSGMNLGALRTQLSLSEPNLGHTRQAELLVGIKVNIEHARGQITK